MITIRTASISVSNAQLFARTQVTMTHVLETYIKACVIDVPPYDVISDFIASLPHMLDVRLVKDVSCHAGESWTSNKIPAIKALREMCETHGAMINMEQFNNKTLYNAMNEHVIINDGIAKFGNRMGLKEAKDFIDMYLLMYYQFCDIC